MKAGLVGVWVAKYDPSGVITNPYDKDAFAITTNQSKAMLASRCRGREREGVSLYVNGFADVAVARHERRPSVDDRLTSRVNRQLTFDAGAYRLAESQHLEHGAATVSDRRRHVRPVDPDQ